MTDLAIPTVHLNGTSKASLLEAYTRALEALYFACAALVATAPNGRDYYVQPEGALTKAQAEYSARFDRLDTVRQELEKIILAVDAQ